MHAMCSDLNIRYGSVTDMLKDMEEFRKNPAIRFTFLPKNAAAASASSVRVHPAKPQNQAARQKELEREYERQDREEKRRRIWMIAAICLAAAALIGLLFLILNQSDRERPAESSAASGTTATTVPKELSVPQLVNNLYDENIQANNPYLKIICDESSYDYNDEYPAGVIYDQNPQAGTRVPPGTEVYLKVSLGEETDNMPKLKGLSAENANILLKALKIQLTVLTDREYSDEVPEGYVTRTDPEEGTELKNSQVVTVYISMGKETKTVNVPNVLGASRSNASASVTARNLEIKITEDYSSSVAEGYVISQSRMPGQRWRRALSCRW